MRGERPCFGIGTEWTVGLACRSGVQLGWPTVSGAASLFGLNTTPLPSKNFSVPDGSSQCKFDSELDSFSRQ